MRGKNLKYGRIFIMLIENYNNAYKTRKSLKSKNEKINKMFSKIDEKILMLFFYSSVVYFFAMSVFMKIYVYQFNLGLLNNVLIVFSLYVIALGIVFQINFVWRKKKLKRLSNIQNKLIKKIEVLNSKFKIDVNSIEELFADIIVLKNSDGLIWIDEELISQ